MSQKELVLVSGATGQQGGAIASELLDAGWRVRAMTRKPDGEPARALAGRLIQLPTLPSYWKPIGRTIAELLDVQHGHTRTA